VRRGHRPATDPNHPHARNNYAESYMSMGVLYLQRRNLALAAEQFDRCLAIVHRKDAYFAPRVQGTPTSLVQHPRGRRSPAAGPAPAAAAPRP